jgi:hypothetical protein
MRTNGDGQASQVPQGSSAYQPITTQYNMPPGVQPTLPPLSRMEQAGPPHPPPDNLSSVRHQHTDGGHPRHYDKQPNVLSGSIAGKRPFPVSTETSADSSDEDEDGGELPASGLVAPWEVLRGLADVAIERAAKVSQSERLSLISHSSHTQYLQENGEASEPQSRTRSPSPDPRSRRPSKRRKQMPRVLQFPDGELTTSMRYGSLLIQIYKWCPRALYPKRRPQIYSRCDFRFVSRVILLRFL